jgi:hypothetical protein
MSFEVPLDLGRDGMIQNIDYREQNGYSFLFRQDVGGDESTRSEYRGRPQQ